MLEGVRILDFTRALAGPFATMVLGDLEADIIKIEPPGGMRVGCGLPSSWVRVHISSPLTVIREVL